MPWYTPQKLTWPLVVGRRSFLLGFGLFSGAFVVSFRVPSGKIPTYIFPFGFGGKMFSVRFTAWVFLGSLLSLTLWKKRYSCESSRRKASQQVLQCLVQTGPRRPVEETWMQIPTGKYPEKLTTNNWVMCSLLLSGKYIHPSNGRSFPLLLLMDKILHHQGWWLSQSHYL